jgi:TolA-binding protein
MHLAGWENNHAIAMDERERRVAFKLAWNAVTQTENRAELEPRLDELRVLYSFYLRHPHAPDAVRAGIDAHRKTATTKKECDALDAGEQLAAETWRLDKIEKLAKLDASYPASYARGVQSYRLGRYDEAIREFEHWLADHPDGPYANRARNHLRAALAAKAE